MRKYNLKRKVSAFLMAFSLAASGSFSGIETQAAEEIETSVSEVSTYQQEEPTQSTQQSVVLEEVTSENTLSETGTEEKSVPEISEQPTQSQPEATQTPEIAASTPQETISQETTSQVASETPTSFVDPSVEESTSKETMQEISSEASSKDSSAEETVEETVTQEVEETSDGYEEESSEEETEEESTEEESTEEESTEDEYGIALLDLGDVTQIIQISSCQIEGSQVVVKGKLNQKFKTADDTLYLFEEPMYQKDITSSPIAQVKKEDSFTFSVPLNNNTAQSKLYSKFFVGIKFKDGTYQALSDGHFITNPEALAANQSAYPQAKSKKGLLTDTAFGTDIEELGLSYTNVNIIVNELFRGSGCSYTYNGKTYQYSAQYIAKLDQTLLLYQRNNIIVNAILLWQPDENYNFGYPGANAAIGAYHGWNVVSKEGIESISAVLHFLGERYGRSDNAYGHIASWTVGNEVNADTSWNYTGHQSAAEYAYIYTNMLRITSQAVKSSCAHARIFMSLDMYWHGVSGGTRYDGKEMIDYVNTYMKAEGDIEWNVAFHPYGNPLTEVEWWNDNAAFNENATFISMENISVLTGYLCKNGLRNPDGSVKHIILSEQGYTSHSFNQGNVEWKQAAALAYAYYVAEANPYIDAFIAMREVDAKPEADAGIHQGLWYNDENKAWCTFAKKPAWTVWKYIDTDQSFAYTDSLAPLVGLSSFSSTYGSVMAARNRSVDLGTGGYAASHNAGNSLMNGWYGEYGLTAFTADSQKIAVTAGSNSPFTYAGIARQGSVDFSSQRYFSFMITGTAGASQNLRVRMRFTSGQDTLETEVALKKDINQMIYADLGEWKGRSNVTKIQIWVQQDGTEYWQNGSFSITNICQSSSIDTTTLPSLTITESGYTDVTANSFSAYCKISGTKPIAKVEYSAWNIAASTETTVTKEGSISDGYSKCDFSISEFGGRTGAYGVRIVAYDTDNVASKPVLVSVTVKGVAEALVIYNSYATDISYTGFTVTVEAASDYGLSSSSSMAVWSSSGGQAKTLIWYPLHFANGKATVRVNIASHGNWSGEYNCHAYVTDNKGTKKLYALTASVPARTSKITSASVTDVSVSGYQVSANFECPLGVSRAEIKTWTDKLGETSAVTQKMTINGSKASAQILTSSHRNYGGTYHSVISVYDKGGNCATRTVDVQVPEDPDKKETETQPTTPAIYNGVDYAAVFNAEFYLNYYADLKAAFGKDQKAALRHFVECGMKEGRQASAEFNLEIYKANYADLRKAFGSNKVQYYQHYITYGKSEGRNAKKLISDEEDNKSDDNKSDDKTDIKPDDKTDTKPDDKTDTKPDDKTDTKPDDTNDTDPRPSIPAEEKKYSAVYSYTYYKNAYADLRTAFGNDSAKYFQHFLQCGMNEGRQAIASFDVKAYKNNYADLRKAFGNNTILYYKHYMEYGKKEGRTATSSGNTNTGNNGNTSTGGKDENTGSNTGNNNNNNNNNSKPSASTVYNGVNYALVYDYEYYRKKYADLQTTFGDDLEKYLQHFVLNGMREGRQASGSFNLAAYKGRYSDLRNAFGNNNVAYYMHYINNGNAEGRNAN